MENIAILVLAAGKSTRMNSTKQLEKIGNSFLLEIVLNKIKTLFDKEDIYCVLGANFNKIKNKISNNNISIIFNEDYNNGLSSSIKSGLNYVKNANKNYRGIFIILGDQPAIDNGYFKEMISLFYQYKNKIVASKYKEKVGVPAIFPSIYFDDLEKIEGDKGAKEYLNNKKNNVIFPEIIPNLVDIDTQEDLKLFKKRMNEI